MPLPNNAQNKKFARHMRKNATRQENHLWYDFLRTYPVQFHRQVMIDDYIADFYCHKARLVIELDGSQHQTDDGMQKDKIRTAKLEEYGLTVIRFPNKSIDRDFYRVCDYIDRTVKELLGDA